MLVEHERVDVGAVDGAVATGGPAGTAIHVDGMIHFADEELAGLVRGPLNLHVALEAKIVVAFDEELAVDRTVRVVTTRAAFAKRFVFVNERA